MEIEKENYMIDGHSKHVDKRKKEFNESLKDDYELAVQKLGITLNKVAQNHEPVLIQGNSDIINELVARSIHLTSSRYKENFVLANCTSISSEFLDLEHELFGYWQISSSGTMTMFKNKFELANHGTLYLNRIDELSLGQQKSLLNILQTDTFTRVGETNPIKKNVKIIASTQADFYKKIKTKDINQELLSHLNKFKIKTPQVNKNIEDITILVNAITKNIKIEPKDNPLIKIDALHAFEELLR